MKKNKKKIETNNPSAKPARRVVVLRELDNDDLSDVGGGAKSTENYRPWIWR